MLGTLVEFGKLAKPVTVLIEKISNATGVLYEPTKIRKKAVAEADASKTKALMELEIQDIQKRALTRLVTEEIKKQENIEQITEKSFLELNENAKPENIENDWITNFFDKCKLISDNEMQTLWSHILAGEANKPGSFSKRTIEFISTMDKSDAILFKNLCLFCWYIEEYQPIIINYDDNKILKKYSINFENLMHLAEIGLISFDEDGFIHELENDLIKIDISYHSKLLNLNLKNLTDKEFTIGDVTLTKIGRDLMKINSLNIDSLQIHNKKDIKKYYLSVIKELYEEDIILSEPLTNSIYNNTLEDE